ncbi:DUF4573 domain-containing protein [Streptomyces sp. NPDC059474]|uniref:DUF4573 domain-containing protein n=1 Tax=Streptomyces sp. NPDC059474 TaxID=3346846 RepID=UPI0036BFA488
MGAAEERADHGDRVVVPARDVPDRGVGVERQARDGGLDLLLLAVDRHRQRGGGALAQRGVQLVDGDLLGAAADVDAEDGGAVGHIGVVHHQTGGVGPARDHEQQARDHDDLGTALLLGLTGLRGGRRRGAVAAGRRRPETARGGWRGRPGPALARRHHGHPADQRVAGDLVRRHPAARRGLGVAEQRGGRIAPEVVPEPLPGAGQRARAGGGAEAAGHRRAARRGRRLGGRTAAGQRPHPARRRLRVTAVPATGRARSGRGQQLAVARSRAGAGRRHIHVAGGRAGGGAARLGVAGRGLGVGEVRQIGDGAAALLRGREPLGGIRREESLRGVRRGESLSGVRRGEPLRGVRCRESLRGVRRGESLRGVGCREPLGGVGCREPLGGVRGRGRLRCRCAAGGRRTAPGPTGREPVAGPLLAVALLLAVLGRLARPAGLGRHPALRRRRVVDPGQGTGGLGGVVVLAGALRGYAVLRDGRAHDHRRDGPRPRNVDLDPGRQRGLGLRLLRLGRGPPLPVVGELLRSLLRGARRGVLAGSVRRGARRVGGTAASLPGPGGRTVRFTAQSRFSQLAPPPVGPRAGGSAAAPPYWAVRTRT